MLRWPKLLAVRLACTRFAAAWLRPGVLLLWLACFGDVALAQAPLLSETGNLEPRPGAQAVDRDVAATQPPSANRVLRLEADQRVVISAEALGFDPLVQVRRSGDDEILGQDDDSGEGVNARLYFTAPASGEYEIRVSSYFPTEAGEYRLTVLPVEEMVAAATGASSTRRMLWRVYRGTLEDRDPQGSEGRFDDFQLSLRAGQQVVILLDAVANAFDPIVQVYRARGREGEPLAVNDDRNDGLGSLLTYTARDSEDFIVRVTSFGAAGRGPYVLRIGDAVTVDD